MQLLWARGSEDTPGLLILCPFEIRRFKRSFSLGLCIDTTQGICVDCAVDFWGFSGIFCFKDDVRVVAGCVHVRMRIRVCTCVCVCVRMRAYAGLLFTY